MRMSALTGLGESDLRSKAARLDREISRLEGRLSDGSLLDADILEAARKSLSGMGSRMTDIPSEDVDVVRGAVVEDRDAVVAIAHDGTVRRMPADAFKPQGRGGKGRRAAAGADRAVYCSALSDLLVVTGSGRAIPKKAHEIPEAKLTGRGVPLEALVPLKDGEKAIGLVHVDFSMPHLLFVSAKGHAKRTATEGVPVRSAWRRDRPERGRGRRDLRGLFVRRRRKHPGRAYERQGAQHAPFRR